MTKIGNCEIKKMTNGLCGIHLHRQWRK